MASDGGPAFPHTVIEGRLVGPHERKVLQGLSFRDLAAIALFVGERLDGDGRWTIPELAEWAYDESQVLTDERDRRLSDEQAR
jgi:hypothetical protein